MEFPVFEQFITDDSIIFIYAIGRTLDNTFYYLSL